MTYTSQAEEDYELCLMRFEHNTNFPEENLHFEAEELQKYAQTDSKIVLRAISSELEKLTSMQPRPNFPIKKTQKIRTTRRSDLWDGLFH